MSLGAQGPAECGPNAAEREACGAPSLAPEGGDLDRNCHTRIVSR